MAISTRSGLMGAVVVCVLACGGGPGTSGNGALSLFEVPGTNFEHSAAGTPSATTECPRFNANDRMTVTSGSPSAVTVAQVGKSTNVQFAVQSDVATATGVQVPKWSSSLACPGNYVCDSPSGPLTVTLGGGGGACTMSVGNDTYQMTNGNLVSGTSTVGSYTSRGGQLTSITTGGTTVPCVSQDTVPQTVTVRPNDADSVAVSFGTDCKSIYKRVTATGTTLAAGSYKATVTGVVDPAGHRTFVGEPLAGPLTVTVDGTTVTITGAAPFVTVTGTLASDGSFDLIGSGTVAGNPNVKVEMKGGVTAGGFAGTYELGGDGKLPQGKSITFQFTASKG